MSTKDSKSKSKKVVVNPDLLKFLKKSFLTFHINLHSITVRKKGVYNFIIRAVEMPKKIDKQSNWKKYILKEFVVISTPAKSKYLPINFINASASFDLSDQDFKEAVNHIENLWFKKFNSRTSVHPISEKLEMFLTVLFDEEINGLHINRSDSAIMEIFDTVANIFKTPSMCKTDKKGMPYFPHPLIGNFWIRDSSKLKITEHMTLNKDGEIDFIQK